MLTCDLAEYRSAGPVPLLQCKRCLQIYADEPGMRAGWKDRLACSFDAERRGRAAMSGPRPRYAWLNLIRQRIQPAIKLNGWHQQWRTEDEMLRILALCEAKSLFPCGCGIQTNEFLSDVIYRENWRPEWGERPKPRPAIEIRNLIYHVYASRKNDLWRKNLAQLRRRIDVFNGRRVVAVIQGEGVHDLRAVLAELSEIFGELLVLPNDARLREVATFLPLLKAIRSTDPREATFYGHTKGNATDGDVRGATLWRNAMYHVLLDDPKVTDEILRWNPCIGTHRMVWPKGTIGPYPTRLEYGNWMFSGTFFWFRHDAVFANPAWSTVPNDRYGAEAWLSGMFEPFDGVSLFQPWPSEQYPTPSPYDVNLYTEPIEDE